MKRESTPIAQVSLNRGTQFGDAESKVEGRTVIEDRGFQHQTNGEMDIEKMRYLQPQYEVDTKLPKTQRIAEVVVCELPSEPSL